jgi:lysophospholipase L1-like esterase
MLRTFLMCFATTLMVAAAARGGDPLRLLALGDSYTIGESVAPDQRWPVQLAAALTARGLPTAPPEIVATTGWTTDELAAGIDAAALRSPFDLVTLMIGVNNQYRGRPLGSFRLELRDLLARAVAFAGGRPGHVLVLSIPDWGVMPFASGRDRARIAREIDAFNAVCREEASRTGAVFIDVTDISRGAAQDPSLIAGDGLHPSGRQYARWVERILPVAIGIEGLRSGSDGGRGRRD